MAAGAEGFLRKKGIEKQDIIYIVKEDKKTVLVLRDGRHVKTIIPAKEFLYIMEEQLLSINKGVLLSKDSIVSIRNGIYLMKDGTKHKGRVRTPGQHKKNRDIIVGVNSDATVGQQLLRLFAVFDHVETPVVLIEVVMNHVGIPTDYVFRYVNDEFIKKSGQTRDAFVNRSMRDIYPGFNTEHAATFAEVAKYGSNKVIETNSPQYIELGAIYCYRPEINYCACVAIPK